jgi:1-deoxy-D-xylulose-5-phosphate reductoisomerase
MMKKRIAILGSTGSIGTQALNVINNNPSSFQAEVLTAQKNADLLIEQALRFKPGHVVIADKKHYDKVKQALSSLPLKVYTGEESLSEVVTLGSVDVVLTAIVGFAGLLPTIAAIRAGKNIALANKETLVVGGELVTSLAHEKNVSIYPVDSEHSAIFQCLAGENTGSIEKIYLTASGGPFRGMSYDSLRNVTKEQALMHPNWNMGNKVTIDSATLMNKGLEVIEAKWLFGTGPDKVEVIVHPQSIIHSIVQFRDGSMKAQMGLPDMHLPIQYALSYPERLKTDFRRFSFHDYPNLTFEKPDLKIFRNLPLAYEALKKGGNMPCTLNAANESVVEAFLNDKIAFLKMPDIIEQTMKRATYIAHPSIDDYSQSDKQARDIAMKLIKS